MCMICWLLLSEFRKQEPRPADLESRAELERSNAKGARCSATKAPARAAAEAFEYKQLTRTKAKKTNMFGGLFGGRKSEATKAKEVTKAKEKLAKVDPNSRNGRLIAEAKPLLAKKRSKLEPGDEDEYLVEISRALDSFAEDEKDTSLDAHRKRLRWESTVNRIFLKISKMGEAHCGVTEREKQALYDLYDFKPKGAPPKPQPQQQTFTAAEAPPVVNLMPSSAPPPAQFQKPQKLQHGTKLYHASPKRFRESIRKTGLRAGPGRCGHAVYMVFTPGQAHKVGIWHCGEVARGTDSGFMSFDIWSITVDQKTDPLHVETHPAWCRMQPFKEVMVPERLTGPDKLTLEEEKELDMSWKDLEKLSRDLGWGDINKAYAHMLK